ncbi:NAD(P)H-hydrate epimerase / ADP-dependent (S)-NAD(P)H-hydrate dehydratase [hydrothermal vent metagenome]|uniref:Nicotinamide nucleotide repair protein n=1 Tax=hydrothermal vent metagenome TaxID=652676 RepID=A0A3B1AZS6_9ZZZZ
MSYTATLPCNLYLASQVRELDRIAIEDQGIPGLTLMELAGTGAFKLLCDLWPDAQAITVVCGIGNNGGDGFVVARLALQAGKDVRVLQLGSSGRVKGDALANHNAFIALGGEVRPFTDIPSSTDVIVDGIFGTGLEREVAGEWQQAIAAINRFPAPVLALDIPSGLHSDTGRILGAAIEADATISFIGLKQGVFTGSGPDCCGRIWFDNLAVPNSIYEVEQPTARRVEWDLLAGLLGCRPRTAHKGDFGHVLVIGGDHGFSGAVCMAGAAALLTGAGLVTVATRPEHAALLSTVRPELMSHGVLNGVQLAPLIEQATVIAIGPGLGQSAWGMAMLACVLEAGVPLVVDADALNLLASDPAKRNDWILTPHPGEAARLLGMATPDIQLDRFQAAHELQKRYGGVAVLKGAGTLIQTDDGKPVDVCTAGNPGMASGGMGDVLTGIIAGMVAQGLDLGDAATAGVCLHAAAGDRAARVGERGLLASDLLPELRLLLNAD